MSGEKFMESLMVIFKYYKMTDQEEADIILENTLYDYELMCKEEDLRYKDIEKELDNKE